MAVDHISYFANATCGVAAGKLAVTTEGSIRYKALVQ